MQIKLSKQSSKFLSKLSATDKKRILTGIENLPNGNIKPLQGKEYAGFYRLRINGWRIIYRQIDDIIFIDQIGNRGDVYK